jgi:hypothetical protein
MCRNRKLLMLCLFLFAVLVAVTVAHFSPEEIHQLHERVNQIQLSPSQLSQFHSQLAIGIALREDFELLRNNIQQEDQKILEVKEKLLQRSYQKLLEMTDPLSKKGNRAATIAAIQRGKQRRIELQRKLEDEKLANEHLTYVSNLRKLEIVDGTIQTLRHRAVTFELSHDRKLVSLLLISPFFVLRYERVGWFPQDLSST